MRKQIVFVAFAALTFFLGYENVQAKIITPKNASKVDMETMGVAFGSFIEIENNLGLDNPFVTYYIRKKGDEGKPQALTSKKGPFALSLEPGVYEIYDWILESKANFLGTWSGREKSKDRYEFEVKPKHVTYIGQIVSDVYYVESSKGNLVPRNHPWVSDQKNTDIPLFSKSHPMFFEMGLIIAAKDKFRWC
jgi:hypothetical protein